MRNLVQRKISRRRFVTLVLGSSAGLWLAPACPGLLGPIAAWAKQNYYLTHKEELLAAFQATNHEARLYLAARYGEKLAEAVTREAANRFSSLLPHLPEVGGQQNIDTPYLPIAAWYLAYYQPMQAYGKNAADVGRMIYDLNGKELAGYPQAQALAEGARWFARANLEKIKKWAAWTQKREYPANWVATFIRGEGKGFDFGYDYQECAVVKYLQSHQAAEVAPYVCLNDFLKSRTLGTGLQRSLTLAQGEKMCNFRFKQGRPVTQNWDTEVPKFPAPGRSS